MKKAKIRQPNKAREKQGMTIVFEERAFKPRMVQAEVVNEPEIRREHRPAPQIEIDRARSKEGECCHGCAYLDGPLSRGGKLMHPVKWAVAPQPSSGETAGLGIRSRGAPPCCSTLFGARDDPLGRA